MRIPFCPFSVEKTRRLLRTKLYGFSDPLSKFSPSLSLELEQAGFDINSRDYISIALFSATFMFLVTGLSFFVITFAFIGIAGLWAGVLVGLFFLYLTFFYIMAYPKLILKRRVQNIEKNIIYALRHLYIQVTSGVTLFDAMVSVSQGNYGQISYEFRKAIKSINTGMQIESALEELTLRNPSLYFRRAMWQISSGVKTGSDIGQILRTTIDYISAEQKIMIRRYGSQLNPLTVAYMMIAVILPSLGITFLMVVSSFAKIPITENTFWGILAFITIFQFMFLGILKSKRPNML